MSEARFNNPRTCGSTGNMSSRERHEADFLLEPSKKAWHCQHRDVEVMPFRTMKWQLSVLRHWVSDNSSKSIRKCSCQVQRNHPVLVKGLPKTARSATIDESMAPSSFLVLLWATWVSFQIKTNEIQPRGHFAKKGHSHEKIMHCDQFIIKITICWIHPEISFALYSF